MKRVLIIIAAILLSSLINVLPVKAGTANPDVPPAMDVCTIYQNVLETGDIFIFLKENTPYVSPPSISYNNAFFWQLYNTSDNVELARTTGYSYHTNGYNKNIIGFYFSAAAATADNITWGQEYYLKLTGTPYAFVTPPTYQFPIQTSYYSSLTDRTTVQQAISSQLLEWAGDLNLDWGLATANFLTTAVATGEALSLSGEAFFRGAIYGIQSMAPYAFEVQFLTIDTTPTTWTQNYTSALVAEYNGTYLQGATNAGNSALGSSYNLFGELGLFFMLGILGGACIVIGGDIWGTLVICAGPLVIGARTSMIDIGQVAFIAALAWLWTCGKMWKVW